MFLTIIILFLKLFNIVEFILQFIFTEFFQRSDLRSRIDQMLKNRERSKRDQRIKE